MKKSNFFLYKKILRITIKVGLLGIIISLLIIEYYFLFFKGVQ